MSRFLFIFLYCFLFLNFIGFGQLLDSTIVLKELSIVSSKDRYLAGSKTKTFDSIQLNSESGENLTELINHFLPIYIKQDAGGLATIRFRGTSPNHTAIMFNGININSLTLGHSNISNLPNFLFDEIKIQYGSSSSLYGSDAIGGSVHLNNNPTWNSGFNASFQQDFASFNSYFNGIKVGFSNSRFQYTIKAYHQKKKNNFSFLNTAVKDFERNKFITDTVRNAAVSNYGILQEIYYKISEKTFSFFKLWYEDNWHQIQPNMSANYYGGGFEEIKDKHLRFISGFKHYSGQHKFATDIGYISDYELYNKVYDQTISTNNYILNVNYTNSSFLNGDFQSGTSCSYITPKVYAYNGLPKEARFDFFALYLRSLLDCLNASLNLRESFVSNYKSQFTPSFGLDYTMLKSSNHTLNFKFAASKSYKTPTFNDRFWNPGGNPNLLSEKGMNYELNTNYKLYNNVGSFKIGLSYFLININNLIQWVNMDVWRPLNVKKVRNSGIEFNAESAVNILKFILSTGVNYSYTKSRETKSYNNQNLSNGKQLMYTPEHLGNAFISLSRKNWNWFISSSYTGERNTETYKILEGYLLLNTSFGTNLNMRNNQLSVNFKVNNILNKAYQNQELYAMPGINYVVSLKISINNIKVKNNEKN
ncbi:MAG: TonB-dependent receptor [Bacteroidales bacterium]|nr:TonB-dependent receptor [Bacteroidales bacterium]